MAGPFIMPRGEPNPYGYDLPCENPTVAITNPGCAVCAEPEALEACENCADDYSNANLCLCTTDW